MSPRNFTVTASALSTEPIVSRSSTRSKSQSWVEPSALPNHGDVSNVKGNAPGYVKQLVQNTFFAYGVGRDQEGFGFNVGSLVQFVDISVDERSDRKGKLEATTVAEISVTKSMLNGAGMLHGGCIGYLVDNLASTPLVALGLYQNINGVGVTQALNVAFHSPAPLGTCLNIISSSVSVGGRVMSARCEIVDKISGRIVASGALTKMQPTRSKL